MLHRLDARHDPIQPLTDAEKLQLYEWGGGHASLMRALYFASRVKFPLHLPNAFDLLARESGVRDECEKMGNGLTQDEWQTLCHIVRNEPADPDTITWLAKVGLLRVRPLHAPDFCSPVLEKFVQDQARCAAPIVLDFNLPPPQVRVDGGVVTTLRMPEYDILKYLWDKRSGICTQSDLILVLLEGERKEPTAKVPGTPPQRLEQYIRTIKAKIGPAGQSIQAVANGYRWGP
jgi:hypothetical protein